MLTAVSIITSSAAISLGVFNPFDRLLIWQAISHSYTLITTTKKSNNIGLMVYDLPWVNKKLVFNIEGGHGQKRNPELPVTAKKVLCTLAN